MYFSYIISCSLCRDKYIFNIIFNHKNFHHQHMFYEVHGDHHRKQTMAFDNFFLKSQIVSLFCSQIEKLSGSSMLMEGVARN